jgi:hypothetical protein
MPPARRRGRSRGLVSLLFGGDADFYISIRDLIAVFLEGKQKGTSRRQTKGGKQKGTEEANKRGRAEFC